MKINTTTQARRSGFTLIEMIGVLAVIAVLAALLIPRIFATINESRVNGAALSYNSLKSASMSYFGKYGRFGDSTGAAITGSTPAAVTNNWDKEVLLRGGFLEKPFATKLGDSATVVINAASSAATVSTASNSAYNLDGDATVANEASGGQYVLEVVLTNVAYEDAKELNRKIDGEDAALGESSTGVDVAGRVKYSIAGGTAGTVRVYVAHK